jgi:hypothetical protein
VPLAETCTQVDGGNANLAVIPSPEPVNFSSATCDMGSVTENPASPSFSRNVDACTGAASAGSCDAGGSCLPEASGEFDQLCVFAPGDIACPAGFNEREVFFTGTSDERDCPTQCGCEAPSSAECPMLLEIYDSSCTSGNKVSTSLVSSCFGPYEFDGSIRVRNIAAATADVECQSSGSVAPTGSAAATGAITYCCLNG